MKYWINGNEGKLVRTKFASCQNCLLKYFPSDTCGSFDICDLDHIIGKSEDISSIFTL